MSGLVEENDDEFAEIPDSEKTPVTIVTGFLGAGKTTLVNYILKEQNKWKICVVENEFGEVAIDDMLVEDNMKSKEDIITMDNGCVCCTIRGDLVRTFGTLVHKRKNFDAVILETTGLADPSPIVFTFNSNAILQDNYRIDSVVCLVDAKHVNSHLDEVRPDGDINEAERQIAFADRIVLNKLDLVSKDELDDVKDRIASINSFASLITSERSRVPLDQVLGLSTFSLDKLVEIDPTMMLEDATEEAHDHSHSHSHDANCGHDHEKCHDSNCGHDHSHSHSHDANCGHDHEKCHDSDCGHDHSHSHSHDANCGHDAGTCTHDHDHAHVQKKKKHNLSLVSSVGFTIDGLLDVALFNNFMSELLKVKAVDMYRTKGVLAFADQGDVKFVFQGVHDNINFGPAPCDWKEGEKRSSKMVFIGRNLDYDSLKASLEKCGSDLSKTVVTMHKRA